LKTGTDEQFSRQTSLAGWEIQVKNLLRSSSTEHVALVGMGHPFRGDDYAGSYIVKTLMNQAKGDLFGKIRLVDAEDNVEAIIGKIAELGCRHVVFVDACEMQGRYGETHLIPVSQTTYPFFTTHGIPLKLIADRLLPESQVWLLAIQPKNTDFGEDLSPEIRDAANSFSNFIRKLVTEERSS